MNTTAGSFAFVGSVPQDDSTMAKKLKAAGAIILAKANLSRKPFDNCTFKADADFNKRIRQLQVISERAAGISQMLTP